MGGSHLGWNAWTGDARVYTKSPTAPAMSSNEDRSRKPEPEGTDQPCAAPNDGNCDEPTST